MKLLRNLSIRAKLTLISLVPLLGLLYYLQENVRKELGNRREALQLIRDVIMIERLSALVHELQKERSQHVVYAISKDSQITEGIYRQREITDKAISDLKRTMQENNYIISNLWLLDSLSSFRRKADAGAFADRDNQSFIAGKTELLNEINKILRASSGTRIKNNIEDHVTLLYAKDILSLMRGHLAQAIIRGEFNGLWYGIFASAKGTHEMNVSKLRRLATPEFLIYFQKQFQGPYVDQTYTIIDSAFSDPNLKNRNFDYEAWNKSSTASVNLLKDVEDFSANLIRDMAEREVSIAGQKVLATTVLGLVLIIIIFVTTWLTTRGIVNSVTELRNAAELMARGDVNVSLHVNSRDEVGDLAEAFGLMIQRTKEFSLTAQAIGNGDYTQAILLRGNEDLLGKTLETMRANLLKLSLENETRNWLLTGNSELNDKVKGEKDVKDLAQEVVALLTTRLKAQIGAIYLKENGYLNLIGSYAYHFRKNNLNSFKLGQGLVGQSALEKRPIVFTEVPSDYIKINSGLGSAAPRSIIVFPLLFEAEVKGVVEIGAAHEFSELDIQFLDMIGGNVAIAINAAQSRSKLKQLLEETQRQAEELEVQQEELKQSNEELIEKTRLLENSENELKTQQEELQQSNEELGEKANLLQDQRDKLERTKMEIENKARELEVVSKYKSEFLANMSHELRTPMNSILILSQLLWENKHHALKEKEIEYAKNIYTSGTDLLNLINEILDLAKVESGKMDLEITEVSFEGIFTSVNSMFSEVAKTKAIDFSILADEKALENARLSTDRQRLEQILRNLLSNAFKFTEKGGTVQLQVGKAPIAMTFKNPRLIKATEIIFFKVKDNGIGIPPEKQGIIFEAFQQADGSTKRKYGGTGLGLSICRELASALGGEIDLESQPGLGSTFTLYLPLPVGIPKTANEKKQMSLAPTNTKTLAVFDSPLTASTNEDIPDDRYSIKENDKIILIIEDEPLFANILLDFVRDRQYKGVVANQGNTGLSFARLYKPDAIILDMKLPVLDGREVLRQLKNDPSLRHIPVQIISGYDLKKEGMELGAFDYAKKPVSKSALESAFDKIENFVNRKFKKLLVVEDDELQNKAIRELIGNGDVKCSPSYSGHEAYEMLKKERFDCTIIDLGLPDMSGFDLLEKIKYDEDLNKIPTIVYTGKDLTKEEAARLNKLATAVVMKTVDSHERLLDETILFLHRVESTLPKEKQTIIRKLHRTDEILKNKLVLVVDDDIRNIYSLTNVLKDESMNCLVAENGSAALKILKENPTIDIVLMDVMMPVLDGYDATREIRHSMKLEKLPIIGLTAKAMKGDREKCLASGMSDYISKPVNIEQLLSLMRVWLYR